MCEFLGSIDARTWSAIVATVVAIWAIFSSTREWKRNRLLKGIELIEKFSDKFENSDYRKRRRLAAEYLLDKNRDKNYPPESLLSILGLFETVAYLYKKEIIEKEAIWHYFSGWILPYVKASEEEIRLMQSSDKTAFEDLVTINKVILDLEKKVHISGSILHVLAPKEVDEFLYGEKEA